jgi:SAM-dependent methyltransferase
MISRIILPEFGGGSSVWLTSLIFYQTLLLGGYSFSNLLARKLKPKKMAIIYAGVILLSLLFIPVQIHLRQVNLPPVLHIFLLLLVSIGLPYFVLSTTSPMVQYWIAVDQRNKKRNPYLLYGVSNAGSLLGLLCYPILIETTMTNSGQTAFLSFGFCLFVFLILICLFLFLKKGGPKKENESAAPEEQKTGITPAGKAISWRERLGWMGMSMLPSAALMVFTNFIAVAVINFPLLWVIPLSLYLISFVICFLMPAVSKPSLLRTVLMVLPVLSMTFVLRWQFELPIAWKVAASCACLFAICLYFHGNLERAKPANENLTSFYLYLSLGGCIGSILAGIVATLLFKSNVELHIVIIISFYFILLPFFRTKKKPARVFFQIAAAFMMIISFLSEEVFYPGFITLKSRTFYSSYMVMEIPKVTGRNIPARVFRHGTTVHGGQARDRSGRLMPLFYYHKGTGIGKVFSRFREIKHIGVVGLGTGMIALFGKEGQTYDFFEIDPEVVNIAENSFDNLRTCPADIRHFVGDARLRIAEIPDNTYDMLVLDAFAGGSIPTHLITVEALQEYLRVLQDDGVIMFNITNRYLKLISVLNCAAEKLGLLIKHHYSTSDIPTYRYPTHWVILTQSSSLLKRLTAGNAGWESAPPKKICWSDEFSNLWSVIKFR